MIDTDKYEGLSRKEVARMIEMLDIDDYERILKAQPYDDVMLDKADILILLAQLRRYREVFDVDEEWRAQRIEIARLRSTIEILAADYDSLILDLGRASAGDLDIEEVYEKHLLRVNDK